jgi:hypothetical protein
MGKEGFKSVLEGRGFQKETRKMGRKSFLIRRIFRRRQCLKRGFNLVLSGGNMDETIQFIANYGSWKAIKKLKIEAATDERTVMEFLASLGMGIDRKIEENLRKLVELDKVDAAIAEIQGGKGKEQVALVIAEVGSRKVNSVINEICTKPELQKNEQKELIGFCKVYAMRKALTEAGLMVDYSGIAIPGMKRLQKKKV